MTFDDTDYLKSFTPPEITSCTDDDSDQSIWTTWIETEPDSDKARVSVDLDNGKIRINGVTG